MRSFLNPSQQSVVVAEFRKNHVQVVRNRLSGDGHLRETRIPNRYQICRLGKVNPGI